MGPRMTAIVIVFRAAVALPGVVVGQDQKLQSSCSDAEYSQFDFWVGE